MHFVHEVGDSTALMNYLHKGRADIALTNTFDGIRMINNKGYNDLVPLQTPLAVENLYIYLHKRNAALVPKVDQVIQQMIASGELQKLVERSERELINASLKK